MRTELFPELRACMVVMGNILVLLRGSRKRLRRFVMLLAIAIGYVMLTPEVYAASYKVKNIKHLFDLSSAGGSSLTLPSDVAVNDKQIFVVDGTNNRVVTYDKQGKYLFTIGGESRQKPLFNYPVGMTVQGDRVYVADTGNHTIRIFDLQGKPVNSFKIRSENHEERPIDIAISKKGKEIFVTGNNTHKIQVYSEDGKLLREWGGRGKRKGKFRYPGTMINSKRNEKIIVDVLNARVQMFSDDGKFKREFGGLGVVAGKFFRPKGVARDKKGRIYVSDSYMDLIQVFNSTGEFLHVLGKNNKIRRFTSPAGIAVYDNKLYVTEVLDSKVSVFSLDD